MSADGGERPVEQAADRAPLRRPTELGDVGARGEDLRAAGDDDSAGRRRPCRSVAISSSSVSTCDDSALTFPLCSVTTATPSCRRSKLTSSPMAADPTTSGALRREQRLHCVAERDTEPRGTEWLTPGSSVRSRMVEPAPATEQHSPRLGWWMLSLLACLAVPAMWAVLASRRDGSCRNVELVAAYAGAPGKFQVLAGPTVHQACGLADLDALHARLVVGAVWTLVAAAASCSSCAASGGVTPGSPAASSPLAPVKWLAPSPPACDLVGQGDRPVRRPHRTSGGSTVRSSSAGSPRSCCPAWCGSRCSPSPQRGSPRC